MAAKEAAATDATAPQAGRDDASSWSLASLEWEVVATCVREGVAPIYYFMPKEIPLPRFSDSWEWVRDPERERAWRIAHLCRLGLCARSIS